MRARLNLALGGFALAAQFELPARGVTAVFGASGSGKTTLLRCIAGLERPADGLLEFQGETWLDAARGVWVPPHQRGVGYVFQESSLFPHLDVRANLEYGWRRTPQALRRLPWERAVELLELQALLPRMPQGLSGGERQRVALARAVLAAPRLLLLDEPLAALDQGRRNEILPFLQRLQRELDIPQIHVSHQLDEVLQVAQTLVLLEAGQVTACGPLEEQLARLDLPLALREDAATVVEGISAGHDSSDHLNRLDCAFGPLFIGGAPLPPGAPVRVRIAARDVGIALTEHSDSSVLNRCPAIVRSVRPAAQPAYVLVQLDAAGVVLLARITQRSRNHMDLYAGRRVWIQVKSVALAASGSA